MADGIVVFADSEGNVVESLLEFRVTVRVGVEHFLKGDTVAHAGDEAVNEASLVFEPLACSGSGERFFYEGVVE